MIERAKPVSDDNVLLRFMWFSLQKVWPYSLASEEITTAALSELAL
jgi:hypothetical protein